MHKHSKRKPDKIKICKLLDEMVIDEIKGQKEYGNIVGLMSIHYPEEAGELNINLEDEMIHENTLKNIRNKIKCK